MGWAASTGPPPTGEAAVPFEAAVAGIFVVFSVVFYVG